MDLKNVDGDTGFILACEHADLVAVKLFVEVLNTNINQRGRNGMNGFMCAAKSSKLDAIKYFIDRSPEIVNSKDKNGKNGIDYNRPLVEEALFKMAAYLVHEGIIVNMNIR